MRLLRVELSNFRQYKKEEILFPQKGLIGIRGDNGAGKSTLFNAISWAFYGKYEGVKNSQLRRQGSTTRSPSYVIVDFLYEDNFYRVKRSLSSSPSQNFVQCNGSSRAAGTTNLNDFIENNLFKMDHKAFTACYYAAQDDFDALAKLNPGPRVQMLSKLLRIDAIDDASEQARKDKRILEIELDEAKKHLKDEIALQSNLNESTVKQNKLSISIKKCVKNVNDITKKLNSLTKQKEKSDKLYDLFQQLATVISNLETKKQTLVESSLENSKIQLNLLVEKKTRLSKIGEKKELYFNLLKKKDDLNEEKEKYVAIFNFEKQKRDILKTIEGYNQTINETKEKVSSFSDVEKQYSRTENEITTLEAKLGELRDKVQELTTTIKIKNNELEAKQQEYKKFETLGSDIPCPACKRPLDKEHYESELANLKVKIEATIDEIQTLETNISLVIKNGKKGAVVLDTVKTKYRDIQQQLSQKSGFEARLDSASNEKDKQETLLSQVTEQRLSLPEKLDFNPEGYKQLITEIKQLEPIYEEILQLESSVKDIPTIEKNIFDLNKVIEGLTENISEATTRQLNLKFDKKTHHTLIEEIEEQRMELDTLKDVHYSLQSEFQVAKTTISTIEKDIQENEVKKNALKNKQLEILELTKLDMLFKTYKTDKLAKLSPTLSEIISDMIDILTDGKYDRVELDDSYNIFIYRDGEKMPLEIFSGGEKKLAALCQRIAISQLLVSQTDQAKFDMLALDEVFGAMDSKRQDSLIHMFRNLNDMFSQILIVAHNEYVKDLFEHTLHIELNNDNTSIAKWITDDYGKPTWDEDEVRSLLEKYYDDSEASEEDIEEATV